ncbi:MAG: glycoside hydrolase family 9 protein [Actinomycetota bacterium]
MPGRNPAPLGSAVIAALGAVVVVSAIVGTLGVGRGWLSRGPDIPRLPVPPVAQQAPEADPAEVGRVAVADPDGVVGFGPLMVQITAPAGASEMQVGTDPTFDTLGWLPVASSTSIEMRHGGAQQIFARFRSEPGAPPTAPAVAAVMVDSTIAFALSSAEGLHRPSWVRARSDEVTVVRIEAGRVERVGDGTSRLVGRTIDVSDLAAGRWAATAANGDLATIEAESVRVVSRPRGTGRDDGGGLVAAVVHDVEIRWAEPLRRGQQYRIAGPADLVEDVFHRHDPDRAVSPAIRVNQHGHHPADRLKVAYLISALTPAPAPPDGLAFRVVDDETGTVVHTGSAVRRPSADEIGRGDLTGAAVFELDYSAVDAEGRYRVCVDGIGCSEPVTVSNDVWAELVATVSRAMYHQRSGIALGPPHTPVARPRSHHPDDGATAVASTTSLLDVMLASPGDPFPLLIAGATAEAVPEAWGGHADAGDWDRRIQHLWYVRAAIEALAVGGERFTWDLNIPESGDTVPDLLDEALWSLDAFARLQHPDGAVPGGVESAAHPQPGATSWTDDLARYVYAPDPFSTYVFAGVAAQAAGAVEPYEPDRAATYDAAALAAMNWAETAPVPDGAAGLVAAQRAVAAAALLQRNGDPQWHAVFTAATTLDDQAVEHLSCANHGVCDAAWLYLGADTDVTQPALRAQIEAAVVTNADLVLAAADTTALGWTMEDPRAPLVWGNGFGGAPHTIGVLRAYLLTGDDRYRAAAERAAAVTLGANPTGTSFITGVGTEPVRYPLIVDAVNGGVPVWPGTPVYGPHSFGRLDDDSWVDTWVLGPSGVTPDAASSPFAWQWFDVSEVAMVNEFTVFQSHAAALHAFAVLAATARPTAGAEPVELVATPGVTNGES